jgi:hypothetical protein
MPYHGMGRITITGFLAISITKVLSKTLRFSKVKLGMAEKRFVISANNLSANRVSVVHEKYRF